MGWNCKCYSIFNLFILGTVEFYVSRGRWNSWFVSTNWLRRVHCSSLSKFHFRILSVVRNGRRMIIFPTLFYKSNNRSILTIRYRHLQIKTSQALSSTWLIFLIWTSHKWSLSINKIESTMISDMSNKSAIFILPLN